MPLGLPRFALASLNYTASGVVLCPNRAYRSLGASGIISKKLSQLLIGVFCLAKDKNYIYPFNLKLRDFVRGKDLFSVVEAGFGGAVAADTAEKDDDE